MNSHDKIEKTKILLDKLRIIRKEQEERIKKISVSVTSYGASKLLSDFLSEMDKTKAIHQQIDETLSASEEPEENLDIFNWLYHCFVVS